MDEIKLDLVEVPEGTFIMGANMDTDVEAEEDEEPERQIWLSTYKIQRTTVTIDLWMQFLQSTTYHWNFPKEIEQETDGKSYPISYVTWFDAYEFTKWLSEITGDRYALPTEAQWEKACRGECGQLYPWGNEEPEDWYEMTPVSTTLLPVGVRLDRQSPYGCLDMWQNIAEWCLDWYDEEPYDYGETYCYNDPTKTINPTGPEIGEFKVFRGGVDQYQSSKWPRCSNRGFQKPYFCHDRLGFRVVLNL